MLTIQGGERDRKSVKTRAVGDIVVALALYFCSLRAKLRGSVEKKATVQGRKCEDGIFVRERGAALYRIVVVICGRCRTVVGTFDS